MPDAKVSQLWVFPVKGCQGFRVSEWELCPTGLRYDRHWCIVDVNGVRYPSREALSGRKVPKLASIRVNFVGSGSGSQLELVADGKAPLRVPVDAAEYESGEEIEVRCSGLSTTDPQSRGWSLGTVPGRSAGKEADEWLTEYLNREDIEVDPTKRKLPKAQYSLVRGTPGKMRSVADYAGPKARMQLEGQQLEYVDARKGDGVAFQDWSPFLMTSLSSALELGKRMGATNYPVLSGRGSIVVEGAPAWDEEEWLEFTVGGVPFRKLKECPRCNVPNRDQTTGEFLFESGKFLGAQGGRMKPMGTLRRMFPQKAVDAEWGIWMGPFFGVYVGHDSATATLREGMPIAVRKRRSRGAVGFVSKKTSHLLCAAALCVCLLNVRRGSGLAAVLALLLAVLIRAGRSQS
eukprot:TRINITY_DN16590_c0_g1_i1.p1 TRINITY_DN16590_c0_g1~~TRINITY_DN16590_c0_g1_i1.p1  ORF type:complete len:425 (+),score=44.78 TRINITY_DN16590_c0_g1_i1:66-1277(+)